MSKHTPGPWVAATKPEQNHRVFFIYRDDGSGFIPALEIATVYSGGNPNAREDARLIAAAPALLGALYRIAGMRDRNGNEIEMHVKELRAIAHAAIAKAEGTTSS